MHRLDRASVPAPPCITPYDRNRRYDRLRPNATNEIRTALLTMQQNRCAYCERRAGPNANDGHIEHFRNQSAHPELSTDWNNLFWSCKDESTCGKHKDKCDVRGSTGKCRPFDCANVIDPCADDPEHFMQFISDGKIQPRRGLTPTEEHRYNETIRVFQLADAPFLVDSRRDAVKPYTGILSDLISEGPERVRAYIDRELTRLGDVSFATAIRHFLQDNRP